MTGSQPVLEPTMRSFRCPVCRKQLTKREYESALGILGEREQHMRHQHAVLASKVKKLGAEKRKARADGVNAERSRTQRLLAGKDQQIRVLHERLRNLKKGTTPQTDGLEFEERLHARLQEEFGADHIKHD